MSKTEFSAASGLRIFRLEVITSLSLTTLANTNSYLMGKFYNMPLSHKVVTGNRIKVDYCCDRLLHENSYVEAYDITVKLKNPVVPNFVTVIRHFVNSFRYCQFERVRTLVMAGKNVGLSTDFCSKLMYNISGEIGF